MKDIGPPVLALLSLSALCAVGGCGCSVPVDTVNSETNVDGDNTSNTSVDDVQVDEANVDADTEVNNDVRADTDINVTLDFGGGKDAGDESGGTEALGDDVAFTLAYQGPVNERVDLAPSFAAALAIDSVQWIVRGPVFDEPTILDAAAGFAWGAPSLDDEDDALDEYVLAVRFGDDVDALAWTPASAFCDGACVGRAVSAVCAGTVVMRVWLADGTTREAEAAHESARPTCW